MPYNRWQRWWRCRSAASNPYFVSAVKISLIGAPASLHRDDQFSSSSSLSLSPFNSRRPRHLPHPPLRLPQPPLVLCVSSPHPCSRVAIGQQVRERGRLCEGFLPAELHSPSCVMTGATARLALLPSLSFCCLCLP